MTTTPATPPPLLLRAAAGDPAAFGELVDPLCQRLILFIRSRGAGALGPDCAAEDVLQTVLTTAWAKLDRFEDRGPGSLHRWLVAIARGALGDRVKYQAAKGRGAVRHLESRPGAAPFDPGTTLTRLLARREDWERASRALARLEPGQREVVERHLLAGETLGEVAAALGLAKSTVWERLHRGLSQLRAELAGAR